MADLLFLDGGSDFSSVPIQNYDGGDDFSDLYALITDGGIFPLPPFQPAGNVLANAISSFINSQLPSFVRAQDPAFISFMQTYYEWMEDSNYGNVVWQLRNLINNFQVDLAPDQFLQYFKNDFLPYFPNATALDQRKLLKTATKFYQTKGSEDSIKFLFNVIYGQEVEIYYPKKNILRASYGKWQQPQSITIVLSDPNLGFDIQLLVGRLATGSESNATCVIESVVQTIDPELNAEIIEMYISNLNRTFTAGEYIQIPYGTDPEGDEVIFSEKILSSIFAVNIDPNNRGLRYNGTEYDADGDIIYQGDPVVISGGLANSTDTIQAEAFVGNVTSGQLQSIAVISGGYGFQQYPNTIVTIVGDGTVTANAVVSGVDNSNEVFVLFNTDSLFYKNSVRLNSSNYGFANAAISNLNTLIANSLSFINLAIAPLSSMELVSGGENYDTVPEIDLLSVYDTDLSANLYQVYLSNPTQINYTNYLQARAAVQDLGRIAAVAVLNGGTGYNPATDTIYIDSINGYGASFSFTVDGDGSIVAVTVVQAGYGYPRPKPPLNVANSANSALSSAGSGAILQPYGDNDGEDLSISVLAIGQIEDIRLVNKGFDYVSPPIVSLRVQDITIQQIPDNEFYFQGDLVYQGASPNNATFLAYVDSYDRGNTLLRIYNYQGLINVSSTLIGTNINATPISTVVYGNGKAKANITFPNLLTNYPGFYLSTDGFLSADQYLQGSQKYHNYSYILKTAVPFLTYEETLKNIAHPAGMSMLGLYTVSNTVNRLLTAEAEPVQLSNNQISTGTVSIDSTVPGFGFVTGSGTNFLGNVNIGDLIVLSPENGRLQAKQVQVVINAISLVVESNTMYLGMDRLTMTNGSNVLVSTVANSILLPNDVIATNVNGNLQNSLVLSIRGDSILVNTVFTANATNVIYYAYPVFNNIDYELVMTQQ